MTRWITHLCAPTFVLSAYLSGARGGSTRKLSQRLLTRGLWIIFVEFTLVSFGWNLTLYWSAPLQPDRPTAND